MKLILARRLLTCANDKARIEKDMGVLIDGETIADVLPLCACQSLMERADVEVIDAQDAVVMPGMIDAHLHLCFDSSPNPIVALETENAYQTLMRMTAAAQRELFSGVTTIRDAGAKGNSVFALRDEIRKGNLLGPDIVAAGPCITITGGHCHFLGLEVDTPDEVRRAVRQLLKDGADYIKVMISGGNMTPGSSPLIDHYDAETLSIITREAHMHGKKVAAHVHTVKGIQDAITAGIDTLEHCSYKSADAPDGVDYRPELAKQLAERGIQVCPAMGKAFILSAEEGAPLPDKVAIWAAFQRSRFETTEAMYRAGVTIIAGTDAGCKNSYFDELALTLGIFEEKIHMQIEDVILGATARAAKAIDRAGLVGSIEKGKQADILFVSGDPTEDLSALRRVCRVLKRGRTVRQ